MSEWLNDVRTAYQYAEDVRSGKVIAGQYVRLAVERWYSDILLAEAKGFYWDEVAAQKALGFFELLYFTKGRWKGQPFKLEPWQCFIVANIFGWKRKSTRKRRYTEAYVEIPKKNGKTELAAGIALYMLLMDGEPGAEVYAAAYTRDQANICFKGAKSMAKQSPHISKRLQIQTYNMYHDPSESTMLAVSHDANNTEGKNSHCVLFDEYHVHKSDDVKNSLRTGMAARDQPLFFIITTAGANKQGPCYKYRGDCIDILKGLSPRENQFAIIYGLDKGDSWQDPAMWRKANPNYGVSVRPEFLQEEYEKATRNGRAEVEFKTKQLNEWVDADVTWIPSETYDGLADPDFIPPKDAICYAGMDLGRSNDIASLSLFFPEYNFFKRRHYVAEEAAKYAARGGIDYLEWIQNGFLVATPGKTTDYDYILKDVEEVAEMYDLKFFEYDPYSSSYFKDKLSDILGTTYAGKLQDDGTVRYAEYLKLQPFRQGFLSFGPPTASYERKIINGDIRHDGNPVSGWMLGNVSLMQDAAGNIKPAKDKSKDKIDGVVADIMALAGFEIWGNYIDISTEWYA